MNVKATLVLRAITIFAVITASWPSNPDSHFLKRFIYELQRLLSILNAIGLLIPLVLGALHYLNEPLKLTMILSETAAMAVVISNLIQCKWHENQLRIALTEVESFVMTIEGEEKIILHKWVNRYLPIWIFSVLLFCQASLFFAIGPFFTSDLLPATTWYPFEIEAFTLRHYFFFIQQVTAIFQVGLTITADITISFLFCYLSAKLDILSVQIGVSKEFIQLNHCIQEHENCIQYFNALTDFASFMMLKSNLLMTMTIIFGAIPLLFRAPFTESSQFILMIATSFLRIYMGAWPPDDVREMSEKIASSIYDSAWVDASMEMRKSIAFILCRAQKPLIMSMPGLLPPITLQYYASFVSTTLSYFATLRAVISE